MGQNVCLRNPRNVSLLLVLLMLISNMAMVTTSTLDNKNKSDETSGRQLGDVDCSDYTFEDLFFYNHAKFEMEIIDDWASTITTAVAYVNGSNSAVVRESIDGLFDGLPGGNDSWLSTDEREAVREVGPKCVSDMTTRIGIREGSSHRGNVDWNDLTWVEEGIKLDEVQLVPEDHPQTRDCQHPLNSDGCKEVPVTVTDDMEIYLLYDDDAENNMIFDKLPNEGVENFTFAMNATNMSNAALSVTFPPIVDLRVAAYEVQLDGVTDFNAPQPTSEHDENGSLVVNIYIDYDYDLWPIGMNLFMDMTTDPVIPDSNPEWSDSAPTNGTVIPAILDGNEIVLVDFAQLQTWADDESQVTFDCTITDGVWKMQNGNLLATTSGGSLTCSLMDLKGQQSNSTRTWIIKQPATFTADTGYYMDSANVSVSSTDEDTYSLTVEAGQDGTWIAESSTIDVSNEIGTFSVNIGDMSPGPVYFRMNLTGENMLDWVVEIDLGIFKESRPPTLILSTTHQGENGTWDSNGWTYTISGTVVDPDGENVQMIVKICEDQTEITDRMGYEWSIGVSVVGCEDQTHFVITIAATDDSSKTTELIIEIDPPKVDQEDGKTGTAKGASDDDDDGLPAPGAALTIFSLICALFVTEIRRKIN